MCKQPEALTYDWIKTGGRSLLVSRVIGHLSTATHSFDYVLYQLSGTVV